MKALLLMVAAVVGCAGDARPAASPTPSPVSAPAGDFIRELPTPGPLCVAPADCSFVRSL